MAKRFWRLRADTWKGQRWILVGSSLWILVLALAVGIASRDRWNWAIFLAGFGFGVLGATSQFLIMAAAARSPRAIPERRAEARSRCKVYMFGWVVFGTALGSAAGGLDSGGSRWSAWSTSRRSS